MRAHTLVVAQVLALVLGTAVASAGAAEAEAPPPPPEEELFGLLAEAVGRVDVRERGCEAVAASLEAFVAERRPRLARLQAEADARFRAAGEAGRRAILGRLDALARQAFGPEVEEQVRVVRPECPRQWPRIQAAVLAVGGRFGHLTRYFDPAAHAIQTVRAVLGIMREKGADCAGTRRAAEAFAAAQRAEFGSLAGAVEKLQSQLSPDAMAAYSARLQAEVGLLVEEISPAFVRVGQECPADINWFGELLSEILSGRPRAPSAQPPRE
ncbi:MAG TPA: hypothetical protein PK668_11120 [Myxococcota bacterium]|nr:hypothetical protein [Myxococcota bacterium]HRY93284.1 hypothetical protein [Myxococcota bacterium]HSA23518.1 hypothetical protein [Myxococcota bacterium]